MRDGSGGDVPASPGPSKTPGAASQTPQTTLKIHQGVFIYKKKDMEAQLAMSPDLNVLLDTPDQ